MSTPLKPLRIGYLFQYESGGLVSPSAWALHIRAVFEGFRRRGHSIRLVSIRDGHLEWSDDLVQWVTASPGICSKLPYRLLESSLRGAQSRLRLPYYNLFDSVRFSEASVAALAGCDVLYERYWLMSYGGLLTARRLGIPLVLEVNGDVVEEVQRLGVPIARAQWVGIKALNRLLFRYTDHVVAVGETIKRRTVSRWGFDPAKCSVVTNGVDVAAFGQHESGLAVRARFGLDGKPLVVFVGSFQPWHGVETLVDAFSHVPSGPFGPTLVLVGDGESRPVIEARVNDLGLTGQVVFTGVVPREDVAGLLMSADVAVVCHRGWAEQLVETPLKLFEYMAAGKAIVAPAVPNMERVLVHGETALLVPPDDSAALAKAISTLLRNSELRCTLGRAARRQAVERHSWDRAVTEIEAIMLGLTSQRTKGN